MSSNNFWVRLVRFGSGFGVPFLHHPTGSRDIHFRQHIAITCAFVYLKCPTMSHNSKCYTKIILKRDAKGTVSIDQLFKVRGQVVSDTVDPTDVVQPSSGNGLNEDIKLEVAGPSSLVNHDDNCNGKVDF